MEAILITYLLHSSLLLVFAWLALKLRPGTAGRVWILRAALLGGIVTTTAARAFDLGTPLQAPWVNGGGELGLQAMDIRPVPAPPAGSGIADVVARQPDGAQAPTQRPGAPLPLPSWPWLVLGLSVALAGRLAWRDLCSFRALAGAEPLKADLVSVRLRPFCRRVRLHVAPGLTSPLALGASTIVLPARLLDAPQGEIDAVVAHELAHLVRRDPLWLGLGRLLVQVAWFQPGLRWALGALESESELAADTWAVELTGRPLDLALALERVARWVAGVPAPSLAAAMAQRGGIVERVERLAQAPQGTRLKPAGWTAAASGVALAFLACTGPSIQEPPAEDAPTSARTVRPEWIQLNWQGFGVGEDRGSFQYQPYEGPGAVEGEARVIITLDANGHWIGSPDTPEANADLLRGLGQRMRRGIVGSAPYDMELALDRFLIRVHPDAPFGAVRDLIQICASQDIGIWRIEIAPSDATAQAIVPVFLPVENQVAQASEAWTYNTKPADTFGEVYPLVQRQVEAGHQVLFAGGY